MFKIILKNVILVVVIFSYNLSSAQNSQDKIIAIVNDKVILKSEVQREINTIPEEIIAKEYFGLSENEILKKVIEKLIMDKLLEQATKRYGIIISDIALENRINQLAKANNMTITEYRNEVIKNGEKYESFIEKFRNKIAIEELFRTQFYSRIYVSEDEINSFLERESVSKKGDIAYDLDELVILDELKNIDMETIKSIHAAIKQKGFAKTKEQYPDYKIEISRMGLVKENILPKIFIDSLNSMTEDKFTEIIKSNKGYHVLKVNNVDNKSTILVNEYKTYHILMKPDIMTSEDDIQKELMKIRNEITDLEAFNDMAKRYSIDKASAFNGGALDWIRLSSVVPEFADVMTKTPPKKVSDPFKSRFGWHILYIENMRSVDDTDKLILKNVEQTIRMNKAKRERDDWMAKLRDQAYIEIKDF